MRLHAHDLKQTGSAGARTLDPRLKRPLPLFITDDKAECYKHGIPSVAYSPDSCTPQQPHDPGLARLIQTWPILSPAVRAGIVAMIEAATADLPVIP